MAVDIQGPLPTAPDTQIPPSVSAFAAAGSLGQLRSIYAPRKLGWVLTIFQVIIGLATAVVLIGLWFLWLLFRSARFSRKTAARRIYVFDNGFVYAETAELLTAYRWDQVATVNQFIKTTRVNGVKMPTQYLYTITRQDGASIKLTNFYKNIAQLGQRISERVLEVQLPVAAAALEQGQPLQFGAITVSASGITVKRTEVPWHTESIRLRAGYVSVRRVGTSRTVARIQARNIPNLYVLLSLAAKYQQGPVGR